MAADENNVRCEMTLRFPSPDIAGKVFQAVEQDNGGYVDAERKDDTIVAVIEASTLRSLLHTLDDLLSCVSVAEKIVTKDG
jgi:tRNA threonylcarbamoyladenosine modification (KEOPS) complex  Pcc1 subunit